MPLETLLDVLDFSCSTFYYVLKIWEETGNVINHNYGLLGCIQILNHDDVEYLLCLVKHNPDYFLDELLHLLMNHLISVHFVTVHCALERASVLYKKLKKIATERNKNLRADFIGHMAQYESNELGFLEKTLTRRFERARRGYCITKKGVFIYGQCLSMEALLMLDGVAACTVVEGLMTKETFLEYLKYKVVCCSLHIIGLFILTCLLAPTIHSIFRASQCSHYGQCENTSRS